MFRLTALWLAALPLVAQGPSVDLLVAESFGNLRLLHDDARQRIIVCGTTRLWEHDGVSWSLTKITPPSGVGIYDPVRERCFFAASATGLIEHDGSALTPRGPAASFVRLASDTVRGRLVGIVSVGVQGVRVEEYSGSGWSTVATTPTSRVATGIVFDRQRGVTVMLILNISGPVTREIWEWDGTTLVGPLAQPAAPSLVAYDPVTRQVLCSTASGPALWNGTTLTQLTGPQPSVVTLAATDGANGRVLALAGGSIWRWDGTAWTEWLAGPTPFMNNGDVSHDSARNRLVALGYVGAAQSPPVQSEWDGGSWQTIATGPGTPSSFWQHSQVFDAARGETVVFGGRDPATSNLLGATHCWNGSTWRLAASTGPQPRSSPALAYDSTRQVVVMVGGQAPAPFGGNWLPDHWEWDGATWTQVAATTAMGASPVVLGFDPLRNRLVALASNRSTYELVGTTWQAVATLGPRLGSSRRMSWNPTSQVLQATLFDAAFTQLLVSTWNGTAWTQAPGAAGEYSFDAATGAATVWTLQSTTLVTTLPATRDGYGTACGGSTTTSSLVAFGRPRIGSNTFHLDVRVDARLRPALLGFAANQANAPLGSGCTVLVQNVINSLVWFTDAAGFAEFPLPVPATNTLRGVTLYAQAAVIDPASPLGLAVTPGLTLRLGD